MRIIAALIVWLFALAAIAASNAEHKATNNGLPLVHSDAPSCPKLANPCATTNRNRVNTKGIA